MGRNNTKVGEVTMAKKVVEQDKVSDLEARYAKALETIEALSRNQAALTAQLGAQQPRQFVNSGQLVVGIRNVSNYSVGLIDKTSGQAIEFNLNPEVPGVTDPRTRAVVSYVFWQQLRSGGQVGKGIIVRDDSVLGPADNAAPEDRPKDMHPDHARNLVIDPREWIQSRTEQQIREDIAAMTSEPTLRRLLYCVDQEIVLIGEERYAGDAERARKAIRDLPALFRVVEELCEERLDELNPVSKVRHMETETQSRYARII
jgi:hypothetical protein